VSILLKGFNHRVHRDDAIIPASMDIGLINFVRTTRRAFLPKNLPQQGADIALVLVEMIASVPYHPKDYRILGFLTAPGK
jgi:hypothetical protein